MEIDNSIENYKIKRNVQQRWSDMDAFGHVNNAVFASYLEEARVYYLDEIVKWDWNINGLILASMTINYRKPLKYADQVEILIKCNKVGSKSFDLHYLIINKMKEIICQASTIMVYFNYKTQESEVIPNPIKEKIMRFENL